ncbi:flagellar biosynthesis regulator FlaF [Abyssibius alkaniclasticus]|uniref:flagellar biosynthesis regulator FlaF n=1 Tax=Abyssibius alkaniclasticus TaxID=2881234 RepID=UPI00236341F2|nr:flagellar biosynthesis regulator FlaF [Abyssibius alkaniclasticus]UPH71822.1 flagellar biosynthesis regulator FlaF [Abyssibius alkaniclasticus]|tara:strand:- start:1988 stop:2368 length:381 start_codon:yes stop_codon:yes gene_type:complete
MNSAVMAKSLYARPAGATGTERSIEYKAFARATAKLAAHSGGKAGAFSELAEALCENQRLWIVLAGDVASAHNGLPATLRARIFFLCEFTQAHSRKVLEGKATPDVLVEVNTAVMRGLRADGQVAT